MNSMEGDGPPSLCSGGRGLPPYNVPHALGRPASGGKSLSGKFPKTLIIATRDRKILGYGVEGINPLVRRLYSSRSHHLPEPFAKTTFPPLPGKQSGLENIKTSCLLIAGGLYNIHSY